VQTHEVRGPYGVERHPRSAQAARQGARRRGLGRASQPLGFFWCLGLPSRVSASLWMDVDDLWRARSGSFGRRHSFTIKLFRKKVSKSHRTFHWRRRRRTVACVACLSLQFRCSKLWDEASLPGFRPFSVRFSFVFLTCGPYDLIMTRVRERERGANAINNLLRRRGFRLGSAS